MKVGGRRAGTTDSLSDPTAPKSVPPDLTCDRGREGQLPTPDHAERTKTGRHANLTDTPEHHREDH